jgi:hypothetical protein
MDTPTPSSAKPSMPAVQSTPAAETLSTQRIKPLYRVSQVVWYIVGVIEILLMLRFILKLLAANTLAGFTQFIYGITSLFAGPFLYVFRVSQVEGNVFEWSTLLAMVVYLLIGWLIVKALVMSKPVSTKEADIKLPQQDKL